MAEVWHNYPTGKTLYSCAFQRNGDVFLSDGESTEEWGTGGRTADNYDKPMVEEGDSGHYIGTLDASIAAGVYRITIYDQAGVNPADADLAIAQGEIHWDGVNEMDLSTVDTAVDAIKTDTAAILIDTDTMEADLKTYIDDNIVGADSDTLEDLSDQLDGLTGYPYKSTAEFGPGE